MRTLGEIRKSERQARRRKAANSAARKKRTRPAHAQTDVPVTSRALCGFAEAEEDDALLTEPELVQYALEDWPESASDADEWLRSHGVRLDEEHEI